MAWVKLDDAFLDHPKFITVGPLAGYLAITGIAWSNRNLTDGFIPDRQVPRLVNFDGYAHRMQSNTFTEDGEHAEPQALASELVDAGLWERLEDGYLIHDYHDYQPSAEAVRAERKKGAERKARSRSRKESGSRHGRSPSGTTRGSPGDASGESVPVPNPVSTEANASVPEQPSIPSLTAKEETSVSEKSWGRLSNLLADLIAENDPNGLRPDVPEDWLTAERLLVTKDGRSPEQVEAVIRWCQADDFERSNVQSMTKLRKRFRPLWQKAARGSEHRVDRRVRELGSLAERLQAQEAV